MGRKITDETLKFNIIVNGNEGQKELNKLERANKKITKNTQELDKELRKLSRSKKKNAQAIAHVTEKLQANKKQIKANDKAMEGLRKEIGLNNLTMKQLEKEARKLAIQLKNAEPNTTAWKEYDAQLGAVKNRMGELKGEMTSVNKAVAGQKPSFDTVTDSANQYWTALKSGDHAGIKAGFKGIRAGIWGITKAGLAFLATPIGMGIAALAGIAFAAKKWFDYNVEVEKAAKLTEQITKLSGNAAEVARVRAKAIEDTFGLPFQENLEAARAMVNAFGISYNEAFDSIEAGAIRGGAANDEYLDSLKEYGVFFSKAGFSVKEFQKIINTGIDLGIYKDKLPDAIKEFNLSMTEGTKTTKDAMINAFGKGFTNKMFKGIKDGSITTKQALAK
ncbi:MAG: phage tail tape measure protein, partial [Flavobacteriaceae bacterium]|nr:phage tail tape measure protein [Flavobacteriaceae bacterium]